MPENKTIDLENDPLSVLWNTFKDLSTSLGNLNRDIATCQRNLAAVTAAIDKRIAEREQNTQGGE